MSPGLNRSLSLFQLTVYGVGTIVGAGIYSVLGAAAGMVGNGVWVSLVLAGVAALLTGLSYAELISRFPRAGAEYHFLKEAFPAWPLLSSMAGMLMALNAAATCATVSLAFGGYLRVFADIPVMMSAPGLLALCTLINLAGIRQATWASTVVVTVEVGGLLLLIAAGFWRVDVLSLVSLPPVTATPAVLAGAALMFFVYIGFEEVANLAEEARTPHRDVAHAVLLSIVLTSGIYLLVAWVVLALVPTATLAGSASPLTTAAAVVAPGLGPVLAVSALFSTASTALISLVAVSRLLYGMARDGALPAELARLSTRRQTPWVAGLLLFAVSCALLPLGDVAIVASVASLGVLAVFVLVHAAVIRLRFTAPPDGRAFLVPLHVGRWPVLPVLGLAIALALMTQFETRVYVIAGVVLAAGLALRGLALISRHRRAG
ncbi:MAG TPA: APC family permease [Moraxellaceae bacterium]|nr:APC family permease [Moraxellaceae bacterium]